MIQPRVLLSQPLRCVAGPSGLELLGPATHKLARSKKTPLTISCDCKRRRASECKDPCMEHTLTLGSPVCRPKWREAHIQISADNVHTHNSHRHTTADFNRSLLWAWDDRKCDCKRRNHYVYTLQFVDSTLCTQLVCRIWDMTYD